MDSELKREREGRRKIGKYLSFGFPRCRNVVSSSLEPSSPTGHYCLVQYSVTNCFIKWKSRRPRCSDTAKPRELNTAKAPLYSRCPCCSNIIFLFCFLLELLWTRYYCWVQLLPAGLRNSAVSVEILWGH